MPPLSTRVIPREPRRPNVKHPRTGMLPISQSLYLLTDFPRWMTVLHNILPVAVAIFLLTTPPVDAYPDPEEGVRAEILYQVDDVYEKMIALAETLPAEMYEWRPDEDTRSVSEVFAHIVESNYFLVDLAGASIPVDYEAIDWEGGVTNRREIIEALETSHHITRKGITSISEATMDSKVDWFDLSFENTVRGTLIHLVKHTFEHHGQIVAYARMNDVVPPWSR